MTKIGANIKKVRTTKGISQQAFADLFALTRGNISSYEENRAEPKIETVIQIANHFNIPLNQFITQNLSIHEILKYNGDKLIEEGKHDGPTYARCLDLLAVPRNRSLTLRAVS